MRILRLRRMKDYSVRIEKPAPGLPEGCRCGTRRCSPWRHELSRHRLAGEKRQSEIINPTTARFTQRALSAFFGLCFAQSIRRSFRGILPGGQDRTNRPFRRTFAINHKWDGRAKGRNLFSIFLEKRFDFSEKA